MLSPLTLREGTPTAPFSQRDLMTLREYLALQGLAVTEVVVFDGGGNFHRCWTRRGGWVGSSRNPAPCTLSLLNSFVPKATINLLYTAGDSGRALPFTYNNVTGDSLLFSYVSLSPHLTLVFKTTGAYLGICAFIDITVGIYSLLHD